MAEWLSLRSLASNCLPLTAVGSHPIGVSTYFMRGPIIGHFSSVYHSRNTNFILSAAAYQGKVCIKAVAIEVKMQIFIH